jgi:hypothetical protein
MGLVEVRIQEQHMNRRVEMRTAALLAALAAGGVLAQSGEKPAAPEVGPSPVVTDVDPAPAQERDSVGAVMLETSPVWAQRQLFGPASGPKRVSDVTRNSDRTQTEVDLARERDAEATNLYKRGAGSLTVK